METVNTGNTRFTGKMDFKKVTAKQAETNPALASKVGKKRESISFDYYIPATASQLTQEQYEMLARAFTEAHIKAVITENGDNWQFQPNELHCSFEQAWIAYNETTTRERALTKEKVAVFGQWYKTYAPTLVETISAKAALMAETVLANWNKQGTEIMEAMVLRLTQVMEALEQAPEDSAAMQAYMADETLASVHGALLDYFTAAIAAKTEISADAL